MITAKGNLIGNITESKKSVVGNLTSPETIIHETPEYKGEYNIIPSTEQQILPTENKKMVKDLVVEKVPYFEVTNAQGGTTAIIIREEK